MSPQTDRRLSEEGPRVPKMAPCSSNLFKKMGVQKLTRSGFNGVSERDFGRTNLPFSRLIKILYLRGENCLQNAHFYKQKGPCWKTPLNWTGSVFPPPPKKNKENPPIKQGFSLLRTLNFLGKKGKNKSKKQGFPCKRKRKEIQKGMGNKIRVST